MNRWILCGDMVGFGECFVAHGVFGVFETATLKVDVLCNAHAGRCRRGVSLSAAKEGLAVAEESRLEDLGCSVRMRALRGLI